MDSYEVSLALGQMPRLYSKECRGVDALNVKGLGSGLFGHWGRCLLLRESCDYPVQAPEHSREFQALPRYIFGAIGAWTRTIRQRAVSTYHTLHYRRRLPAVIVEERLRQLRPADEARRRQDERQQTKQSHAHDEREDRQICR